MARDDTKAKALKARQIANDPQMQAAADRVEAGIIAALKKADTAHDVEGTLELVRMLQNKDRFVRVFNLALTGAEIRDADFKRHTKEPEA